MQHASSPEKLGRAAVRGLLALGVVLACSAASPPPPLVVAPVHIHGMNYDKARHSLILTITGPVTISTRALKAPARLVVDIPAASLDSANRELVIKDDLVARVRVSQFKILPPTVRVVIETATADEPLIAVQQTGKRLYITLAPARPADEPTPEGVLPSPGPEPSDFTPPTLGEETPPPAARPTPPPAPAATPTPTPRPMWTIAPTSAPTPAPTRRPGIQTRLRPGQPVPTPIGRRTTPPSPGPEPTQRPGGEWRDLFPLPSATPARPIATPPRPTPTPFPYDDGPTPIPPPRGTEESGETLPAVP